MKEITKALKKLNSGVVLVAVASESHKANAFTAAWVMQVSFNPVLLAISINPEHISYDIFKEGRRCTVNVLAESQMEFAAHYGQSGVADKMSLGTWLESDSAVPVLQEALVSFECQWLNEVAAGDHQVVICEVIASKILNEGVAMLYSDTENMDGSAELVAEIK
ncbi:MAG: flavin reductase family protein [Methyloprofundus sp.]|nr:flavin reductase family protein [Methyloprofundus sp.]